MQEPTFESVSCMSVLLVIQVISYKPDVTKYMFIFLVCISNTHYKNFTVKL